MYSRSKENNSFFLVVIQFSLKCQKIFKSMWNQHEYKQYISKNLDFELDS